MTWNQVQSRIDMLNQQKQSIEQQINSLQQYTGIPPININNNMQQPYQAPQQFDFNGKFVNNEQEAKGIANNTLPLILFDQSNPIFYMKNVDGSLKKFKFEEVPFTEESQSNTNKINELEAKMNMILDALSNPKQQDNINTSQSEQTLEEQPKKAKGGK